MVWTVINFSISLTALIIFLVAIKKEKKVWLNMNRDELFKFIDENIMDTNEVKEYLGVSRQRIYDLIDKEILVPIRKGIYLRADVEKRKEEQGELREKYYKR